MTDYRQRFKSCGKDVVVEDGVEIEHPEVMEVGDRVYFFRGFRMIDAPQSLPDRERRRLLPRRFHPRLGRTIDHRRQRRFLPQPLHLLRQRPRQLIEIGHHTHFAPGCILYGQGGLTIGPYCNIAAHCVLATGGHDPVSREPPMAFAAPSQRPDHPRRRYLAER